MPTETVTRRAPARGHPVAAARERAGLTQHELAEKVGVGRVSIARIETGTRAPSLALARRIAEALDESLESLFGGER
jgi:DNA-binding XRE family transcriptional regulator